MTDQEILDLMALKAPEDLSLAEIGELRKKLVEVPVLRKMLLEELQLDSYFSEAFARIQLTLPQVLTEAAQHDAQKKQRPIWPAAVYVVLVMTLTYGSSWAFMLMRTESKQEIAQGMEPVLSPPEVVVPDKEPEPEIPPPEPQLPPVEKPPAVPADPDAGKPWEAVLKQEGKLPSFQEVAFQEFERDKHVVRNSELKQWLASVPGMPGTIVDNDYARYRAAKFSGYFRLVSPWRKDAALKFWIDTHNKLQFHFFRENRGLTLAYYEDQGARWIAYETRRNPGQVRPEEWRLTASDFFRTWRMQLQYGGSVEVRFSGEEMILTRGDIVLLRAPFDGLPEETYLDGVAQVYGLRMVRTEDQPPAAEPAAKLIFETEKPAELAWKLRSDKGPAIERRDDGSLRFATAIPLVERAEVSAPLPQQGLHEVIFQLTDITAGAGVFLGRTDGHSHEVIRFMVNPRMKQLQVAGRMGWDDQAEGESRLTKEQPAALVGNDVWLKLTYGLGTMIWQISSDGEHWGTVDFPLDYVPGNVTSFGLQLVAQRPDVGLTLKRLQVRELTGLTDLVPAEERSQGVAVPGVPFLGLWLMEVAAKRPPDVAWSVWQRASAAKTLQAGAARSVACPLADLLIDDALERNVPPREILAALSDLARLGIEYRDKQALTTGLLRRCWDLAANSELPFDVVWKWWQSVPLNSQYLDSPQYEAFVRRAVLARVYAGKPSETHKFLQRMQFYHLDEHVPLIRWAEYITRRELQARAAQESPATIREGWHHPLNETVSKEVYNVTSELRAILESDALEDAAKMISRLEFGQVEGLTNAFDDRALFVSAPNAIRAAILRYPQLEQILAEKYEKLAALRFEEASATGNSLAMQNLALQFHATTAGAAAHKWLADRALGEGRFDLAVAEYRRGAEHAGPALAREIEPHLRLAAALSGQDVGQPVEREVTIGANKMSAREFEDLVQEMRTRGLHSQASAMSITAAEVAAADFPPAGIQPEKRAKLEGPNGDRHTEEGARHVNHYKLPWVDRQLAVAVEQETAYVSNRFQLAAYNLDNGERLWQSQSIPELKTKKAQESALITARPLVLPNRIIVRQLYGDGFTLASFDKENGKLQWALPFKEPEQLVSDPFWIYGSLVVLTGWKDGQDFLLRWTVVDVETGVLDQQREIARFKQVWLRRPSLEWTLIEDGVIVQGAGVVLHLDATGSPRWLRKFVWTPEEEDSRSVVQAFQKPIVAEGRVYVTQPGVRTVACLDLATGWQRWQMVLPELAGIVGIVQERLIVRQEHQLLALEAATGKILWRQPLGEPHPAWLCGPKWIVSLEREKIDPAKELRTNRVVWREIATGAIASTAVLPGFDDDEPRFGLLIPYRDRLFTWAGKTQSDAVRTLLELKRQGESRHYVAERQPYWARALDAKVYQAAAKRFAPFEFVHGLPGDRAGHIDSMHGEANVFGARAWFDKPVGWLFVGEIPAEARQLKLRIGVDDGVPWKLRVTINGQSALEEEFKLPQKDRWIHREIALKEFAGREGTIVISAFSTDGVERTFFWKQIAME